MKRKAAIELSVNFLVVIIISIIILSFGIVLVRKMLDGGGNVTSQVDERLRKQIESSLMRDGKPVSIPIIQQEIKRGKTGVFAIGVLNLISIDDGEDLNPIGVYVVEGVAVDLRGNEINPEERPYVMPSFELLNDGEYAYVKKNDAFVFSVNIKVPKNTPSGEYSFDIYIFADEKIQDFISNPGTISYDSLYDGYIHKLYVKVP